MGPGELLAGAVRPPLWAPSRGLRPCGQLARLFILAPEPPSPSGPAGPRTSPLGASRADAACFLEEECREKVGQGDGVLSGQPWGTGSVGAELSWSPSHPALCPPFWVLRPSAHSGPWESTFPGSPRSEGNLGLVAWFPKRHPMDFPTQTVRTQGP